jgi:hypothetical protein
LSRQGLDPWQEAQRLAQLPQLDGTASPRAGVAKSLSGWTYPFEPAGVQ